MELSLAHELLRVKGTTMTRPVKESYAGTLVKTNSLFVLMLLGSTMWIAGPAFSGDGKAEAWRAITQRVDVDLRELGPEEMERVFDSLSTLVPSVARRPLQPTAVLDLSEPSDWHSPWYFWRLDRSKGFVLLEGQPAVEGTGVSQARIIEFDEEGSVKAIRPFNSGLRLIILDAAIESLEGFSRPVIAISSRSFLGPDVAFQYHTWVGESFVNIRLENSNREIQANSIDSEGARIGMFLELDSPAAWEEALLSPDKAEVLATLTWLGSRCTLAKNEMKKRRVVLSRPAVQVRLQDLMLEEDRWLREAASLVLDLPKPP